LPNPDPKSEATLALPCHRALVPIIPQPNLVRVRVRVRVRSVVRMRESIVITTSVITFVIIITIPFTVIMIVTVIASRNSNRSYLDVLKY
jgi:hypothetical protein